MPPKKKGSPLLAMLAIVVFVMLSNVDGLLSVAMSLIELIVSNMIYTILVIVGIGLLAMLRQVNQYERGVILTMGRYSGMKEPGWRIIVPVFQRMTKVDIRLKAVDVPDQRAITKDNISVSVNAVIYYRVKDASQAILEVEDFQYAVSQMAQTTMRNVVGQVELDELLSERETISEKIKGIIDGATASWGINVQDVELKDIDLPADMERTIGKQAEAERERRAVIIQSEGEVIAASNMAKAAGILATAPGALHLRTLQSINDVSSDQSNTIIFTLPLEILRAFGKTDDK